MADLKRLTHPVLLNMESEAKPYSDAAALIGEVRRLRGLIVEAHGNVEHVTMTPIEAEASAIRDEQR